MSHRSLEQEQITTVLQHSGGKGSSQVVRAYSCKTYLLTSLVQDSIDAPANHVRKDQIVFTVS